jgi:hypothetical protein
MPAGIEHTEAQETFNVNITFYGDLNIRSQRSMDNLVETYDVIFCLRTLLTSINSRPDVSSTKFSNQQRR